MLVPPIIGFDPSVDTALRTELDPVDQFPWFFDGKAGSLTAPHVESIDTVAAGDCFNGALAARLSQGDAIDLAIAYAVRAAALATTRKGAAVSLPSREEVERFMAPVPA